MKNQTKITECLNEDLTRMQVKVDQNLDDPEYQLSGMYYLKVALSDTKVVEQEFTRLNSVQHQWAKKRQNIISFMFENFQNITNTTNIPNE